MARAALVRERLLKEYGQPVWRNRLPPLDELVSTILSQNTNDTNRDRAYGSLRTAYPSWELVRDADPDDVIDSIRSAGLANQKGPRIQQMLREITEETGSLDLSFLESLPPADVKDWLLCYKGVGLKTASIVMLFSLDQPAFPVDTHIHRVAGRLGFRPEQMSAEAAHDHLAQLFPEDSYYEVHLNIIRHGREICQARNPKCADCVLNDICDYYQAVVESIDEDETT